MRRDVVVACEHPEWVAYEWPAGVAATAETAGGVGQVQKWFLFDAATTTSTPTPDGSEFVAWHWVEPAG